MTRNKSVLSVVAVSAAAGVATFMWASAGVGSGEASAAAGQARKFDGDVVVAGTLTAKALRTADGGDVATQKQLAQVKGEVLKDTMDNLTKQLKTRSSSWQVSSFADEINKKVTEALAKKLASRSTTGAAGQLRKELSAMVQAELKRRGVASPSDSRSGAAELARMKRTVDDLQRKQKDAERKLDSLQRELEQLRREVKRK